MNRFLLVPLLLPLLLAAPASANPHSVVLAGTVTNPDGSPAIGAAVFAGGREQVTDAHGRYRWDKVAGGNTFISALAHDGSTYGSGSLTSMNIRLAPQTLQPPDLAMSEVVTAELTREIATLHLNLKIHPDGFSNSTSWLTVFSQDPKFYPAMCMLADPKSDPNAVLTAVAQIHSPLLRVFTSCELVGTRTDWALCPGAQEFIKKLSENIPVAQKMNLQDLRGWSGADLPIFAFNLAAAYEEFGEPMKANVQLQAAQTAAKALTLVPFGILNRQVDGLTMLTHAPRLFDIVEKSVPPASQLNGSDLWWMCVAETSGHGLGAALPYLNQLRASSQTPTAGLAGPTGGRTSRKLRSFLVDKALYLQALQLAITKGGKSDPALALRLAQRAARENQKEAPNLVIRILLEAALSQPQAQRRTLWRTGINRFTAIDQIRFAAATRPLDPELATETYGIALAKLACEVRAAKDVAHGTDGRQSKFAVNELLFAPARARYRAERAFYALKSREGNAKPSAATVLVVSFLDHQRAAEMAHQLPMSKESGYAQQLSLLMLTLTVQGLF